MAIPEKELDSLQHKIDEARSLAKGKEVQQTQGGNASDAMRMSVELVAGVLIGAVFGYFVDRWLGTMPVFFIICFFLGAIAGFRNMIRGAKQMSDETNSDDKGTK